MAEVNVNFYLKRNEKKADRIVPAPGRIRIGKSMVPFCTKVSDTCHRAPAAMVFLPYFLSNRCDNNKFASKKSRFIGSDSDGS